MVPTCSQHPFFQCILLFEVACMLPAMRSSSRTATSAAGTSASISACQKNIIGCQLPWANRKKSGIRVASEGKINPRSGPLHFIGFGSFDGFFCWSFHAKFMGVPLLIETTNQFLVGGWSWTKPLENLLVKLDPSPQFAGWKSKNLPNHHSPQPRHQMLGNEPEFPMDISELQLEQTNWKIRPNIHTSQRELTLGKGYCTDSFNKLSISVMHC